jgi:3-oxoacyl-[acyl-carrier-protein] synthase-3
MSIFIRALATSFPELVVDNSFFGQENLPSTDPMFRGTRLRRHMATGQKASDLIAIAIQQLRQESAVPLREVGVLLTNVSIPDEMFTGCGMVVAKKTGLQASQVFDIHNTGCVSFLYMIEMAETLMNGHGLDSALVCNVQTAGGRIYSQPENRRKASAAIPGDGCAVAYLAREGSARILCSALKNFNTYSEEMFFRGDDGRQYWETGNTSLYIDFNPTMVAQILDRGNRLVPQMVHEVCKKAAVQVQEITWLITNQPNLHFLRNWREALDLREEQHLHTFETYSNLFGAAIPVTLAENAAAGRFRAGDLICLAGFSHAGDYAAATLLRWSRTGDGSFPPLAPTVSLLD